MDKTTESGGSGHGSQLSLASKSSLNSVSGEFTHLATVHKTIHGRTIHSCPYCNHVSYHPNQMEEHINTHTGNRPNKCPYCNASFTHKNTLRSHVRLHTGEKPFVCPVCPYRSVQRTPLKNHILLRHPHYKL